MDRLTSKTEQSIFIMIHNPLSIICALRIWYNISCDHTTRAKWLIFHHGRSHALFNAVDCDLINMKIRNEILDYDISLMRKTKSSWAEDIDFNILNCILMKVHELYSKENLKIRENDMELFYFLSGGPQNLTDAKIILENNYNKISELISIYRFTLFPRRPNSS
ncbi:28768_t:CDS:2, partial [Racocetra persica]